MDAPCERGGARGRRGAALGLAVVALLVAPPALGQEPGAFEILDLDALPQFLERVESRLTLANRFVGRLDYGAYSTRVFEPEGRLRIGVPVTEDAVLRFVASGRVLVYDFDGVSDLFGAPAPGQPFDDLASWTLQVQGGGRLPESWKLLSEGERWGVIAEVNLRARYEAGSSVRHGLRGGGTLSLLYQFRDRFEIAAGLNVSNRLTSSGVSVSPVVQFDWRINDDWRLRSYGFGLQLERILRDDLRVYLRGRLESSRYRLDDRGGTIGRGAVRERQAPVGLGVRWRITRFLRLTAEAGAVAWSQLRVEDRDSNLLGKDSSGLAPYLSLRFDLPD